MIVKFKCYDCGSELVINKDVLNMRKGEQEFLVYPCQKCTNKKTDSLYMVGYLDGMNNASDGDEKERS